jgi:hypothetical protein
MLSDLQGLRTLFWGAMNFNHQQLTHDGIVTGMLEAMHDIDEFTDLFDDLLEAGGIADDADGHAGKASIASLRDDEAIDIEATASKHLANPHQYTWAIID